MYCHWIRKTNAYGNFVLQTSKRPDYVVKCMWKEMQRQSALTEKKALEAMNNIRQANFDKLPKPANAQEARDMKSAKSQVDNVANAKARRLKKLKALETESNKRGSRSRAAAIDGQNS